MLLMQILGKLILSYIVMTALFSQLRAVIFSYVREYVAIEVKSNLSNLKKKETVSAIDNQIIRINSEKL